MADRDDAPGIGPGSRVTLHFALRLEDGMVADETLGDEPMRFTMGDGTLIEGLELALLGLRPGDHQILRIPPEVGFGFRDPEAVAEMPRSDFPPDLRLEEGMIVGFTTPAGDEVPGAIVELREESVVVDLNHPLAGHEVEFEVRILDVEPPEGES